MSSAYALIIATDPVRPVNETQIFSISFAYMTLFQNLCRLINIVSIQDLDVQKYIIVPIAFPIAKKHIENGFLKSRIAREYYRIVI